MTAVLSTVPKELSGTAYGALNSKRQIQGGVLQNDDLLRELMIEEFIRYTLLAKLDKAKNEPIIAYLKKGSHFCEWNISPVYERR